jgi:TonB C terminal
MPLGQMSATRTTQRARNPAVVLVGALASLALHALLLSPILFGTGKHKNTEPQVPGAAANADHPGADGAMIVELIEESHSASSASARMAPSSFISPATLRRMAAVDVAPPEPIPDIDAERDSQTLAQAQGDDTVRARLYGIYVGQISARIERAWLKPRSSPGGDRFVCRVQVLQNQSGEVREVTVKDCNADERWESSLVHAIQSASPLPAPPDPRVFNRLITMQFVSEGFAPGGDSEGFEPQSLTVMNDKARAPSVATDPSSVLEQLRSLRKGRAGVIDLRISGSPGSADSP